MSAYVLVEIEVTDAATYERYKQLAEASVTAYGGRYVVRGGAVEVLEGERRPARLVLLEFPSVERAREWWASPEYSAARPVRIASATAEMFLLPGYAPTAG